MQIFVQIYLALRRNGVLGFCFGRTLVNYKSIMAGTSTKTRYSRDRLQKARIIMPAHDVVLQAFKGELSDELIIEPCYPF